MHVGTVLDSIGVQRGVGATVLRPPPFGKFCLGFHKKEFILLNIRPHLEFLCTPLLERQKDRLG